MARGKYTQVPADTFKKLAINAGITVKNFNPATGAVSGLLGATTGGLTFETTPEYQDFGEDVDNMPKNSKEMKQKVSETAHVSGTLLTIDVPEAKRLMASADIDPNDTTHIIPRMNLKDEDFEDIWILVDYSDEITGPKAGYIAIHLFDALNTNGFRMTTADREKGKFPFDFQAHSTIEDPDRIPYDVYVKAGGEEPSEPYIRLDKHSITLVEGDTYAFKVDKFPADATVTWTTSSSTYASVAAGVVTAEAEGSAVITASITEDGVTYTDTCTVVVEAAPAG